MDKDAFEELKTDLCEVEESNHPDSSPGYILHNQGKIFLQYYGWAIVLNQDGTWHVEGTDGG